MVVGRTDEGILESRKAESLDPLSLIIRADLADALCIARRYDRSVRQSQRTLEMDPNFAIAHYGQLGQAFVASANAEKAIAEFQRAIELASANAAFDQTSKMSTPSRGGAHVLKNS